MQAILKPTPLSKREIVTCMHKVRKYGVLYVRCWPRNPYGRKTVRKIYKQIFQETNNILKCICTTKHGAKDSYVVFVLACVQTTPWVTSARKSFFTSLRPQSFFKLTIQDFTDPGKSTHDLALFTNLSMWFCPLLEFWIIYYIIQNSNKFKN